MKRTRRLRVMEEATVIAASVFAMKDLLVYFAKINNALRTNTEKFVADLRREFVKMACVGVMKDLKEKTARVQLAQRFVQRLVVIMCVVVQGHVTVASVNVSQITAGSIAKYVIPAQDCAAPMRIAF